jgi:acyl-coenzyme A synthetase/AMP-(fatty) acid ligase
MAWMGKAVIVETISAHAHEFPDKIALVHERGSWSYATFARRILAARDFLSAQDLGRGRTAIVCMGWLPEAWVYSLALRSLGHATLAATDLETLARLPLGEEGCIVSLDSAPPPARVGLAARAGWKSIHVPETANAGAPLATSRVAPGVEAEFGDQIVMTSGTTGTYKLVRRNALTELGTVPAGAAIHGLSASSVAHVGSFPLWTAGGYRWPLATWHVGGTVVYDQGRTPRLWYPDLRLTHLFATPATLGWLLGAPDKALRRDDDMHLFVTAGALPRVVADAAKARLTSKVTIMLASTETLILGMTAFTDPEDLRWHRLLPSRVVQVVDEAGMVLPPGEVGQVRARIEDGLSGYFGDEVATREFFRDGYFYPGDLGEFRADGRLALHGRVSDVINVLGSKIATGPIEQAMQDRLGVEGVCILSMPGDGGDEEVHAAIQSRRAVSGAELESFARKELRGFPKVHFHVFEQLPRNAMGKVVRLELRKMLIARGAAPG